MQITLEATHHGPITGKPTMFLEIGEFLDILPFLVLEFVSSLEKLIVFLIIDLSECLT